MEYLKSSLISIFGNSAMIDFHNRNPELLVIKNQGKK
jgi:hypothetical protein